jgi:hypothetical protein
MLRAIFRLHRQLRLLALDGLIARVDVIREAGRARRGSQSSRCYRRLRCCGGTGRVRHIALFRCTILSKLGSLRRTKLGPDALAGKGLKRREVTLFSNIAGEGQRLRRPNWHQQV